MRIDEIFNDTYDWEWNDDRHNIRKMMSSKGQRLGTVDIGRYRPGKWDQWSGQLAATFEVEDDTIWVMFNRGKPGNWFVMFDSQENKMDNGKKYELTGAGHPGRIIATVIEIVKDFLNHYQPEVLHFTANDMKRGRIYKAIVNKIEKYNDYEVGNITDFDSGQKTHVELAKEKGPL